jgi:hypothetical protein
MARASLYCKEINQKIILLLNIWEDEYTGLESLKSVKCNQQSQCKFFSPQNLCPSLLKVKKHYENAK